jgi:hypothetical protein
VRQTIDPHPDRQRQEQHRQRQGGRQYAHVECGGIQRQHCGQRQRHRTNPGACLRDHLGGPEAAEACILQHAWASVGSVWVVSSSTRWPAFSKVYAPMPTPANAWALTTGRRTMQDTPRPRGARGLSSAKVRSRPGQTRGSLQHAAYRFTEREFDLFLLTPTWLTLSSGRRASASTGG